MDVAAMRAALAEALPNREVAVVHSPVMGSPYERVEVYLSDENIEGRHVVVSPGEEYGEDGKILVGLYEDFEADAEAYAEVDSSASALSWAIVLAR